MRRLLAIACLVSGCSAATPDAGVLDAGHDGGARDAGDAGALDAGRPDAGDAGAALDDGGWRPLFSGTDFAGWQRYLGSPAPDAGPLGLENDPRGVFSFTEEDGEPVLHITGEVWGSLISVAQYEDFELTGQYRWGTRTWPPLNFLDSGLMYLTHGPNGAVNAGGSALSEPPGSGAFSVSMEYQLAPNDVGTLYNLGPIPFTPAARTPVAERAGWNDVRITCKAGVATHFLNGAQVASGSSFVSAWPATMPTPLVRGSLQVQSEGGEIFFRRLQLRTVF